MSVRVLASRLSKLPTAKTVLVIPMPGVAWTKPATAIVLSTPTIIAKKMARIPYDRDRSANWCLCCFITLSNLPEMCWTQH
jgi:hypothetical protein